MASEQGGAAKARKRTVGGVTVAPAVRADSPSPFGIAWQTQAFFLSLLLSLAGVVTVWLFGYVFWAILEAVAFATYADRGDSLFLKLLEKIPRVGGRWHSSADGWPLDGAVLLGLLATSGMLYLGFDRLGGLGNRSAAAALLRKTRRVIGQPLPPHRKFVEIRPGGRFLKFPNDIGWLLFYPDRLEFVGDEVRVTIYSTALVGTDLASRRGGLRGAWVEVGLRDGGAIRFLARDNIQRSSDSLTLAPELRDTILAWLDRIAIRQAVLAARSQPPSA